MPVGVLGPINALLADFGPVPVPVEHARRTVQQLSVSCLPSGGHNATPVPRNPPKRHMPTLGGTSPMGSPATSAWGTWDKAPTRVKIISQPFCSPLASTSELANRRDKYIKETYKTIKDTYIT